MASTCREAEQLLRDQDPSGYDQIFKLMKESKKSKVHLSTIEATASSAVKTACDIGAKAAIMAVSTDKHICQMIEGYMCNAVSVYCTEPRGNGNHVRAAFEAGKKAGLFTNG